MASCPRLHSKRLQSSSSNGNSWRSWTSIRKLNLLLSFSSHTLSEIIRGQLIIYLQMLVWAGLAGILIFFMFARTNWDTVGHVHCLSNLDRANILDHSWSAFSSIRCSSESFYVKGLTIWHSYRALERCLGGSFPSGTMATPRCLATTSLHPTQGWPLAWWVHPSQRGSCRNE